MVFDVSLQPFLNLIAMKSISCFFNCQRRLLRFKFGLLCTVVAFSLMLLAFAPISLNASISNDLNRDDSVYVNVDVLPYLKGHKKSTSKELRKMAKYPEVLKVQGVEGDVMVGFVVDQKGAVSNATVENGTHADLGEEAMRAVMASGPWSPAYLGGKAVASKMTVLIRFRLTEEEEALAQALKPLDLENKPPLFVVDGRIVDGGVKTIDFYNVKSIRVVKGQKATDVYGQRGENGIVEVTTKYGTPPVR
jgi:TonB family protein